MTYREAYFEMNKINSCYLNSNTVKKAILEYVSGYNDFFELLKHFNEPIKDEKIYHDILKRVIEGEPYQYVLGRAYFINGYYEVDKRVLIPRQETEQLGVGVYFYTSKLFANINELDVLDLGTGSGVLGIYLKEKFPKYSVFALDFSSDALDVAKNNALKHNVQINFIHGDWLKPILEKKLRFSILISNPPYIEDEKNVDRQVLKYEPHEALFAKPKTKYYEEIFKNYKNLMNNTFLMGFEIGEDMEKDLSSLIEKYMPSVIYRFEKDLYNKTRYLYIMSKGE